MFSLCFTFCSADLTGSCDEELDIHVTGAVAEQATLGFEKETYPNETDCTYVIRTLQNLRIQVSFKIFSLVLNFCSISLNQNFYQIFKYQFK